MGHFKEHDNLDSTDEPESLDSFLRNDKLKQMVLQAQAGMHEAKEKLLDAFKGLMDSCIKRIKIDKFMGLEEARSIAVDTFWRLIMNYTGNDFEHLPGLIKKTVLFALLRALKAFFRQCNNEEHFEGNSIAEPDNAIENSINRIALHACISHLPKLEQQIISLRYYYDLTQKEIGFLLDISDRWVRIKERHALALMRLVLIVK